MTNPVIDKLEHRAADHLDSLADRATELIGSTAGAVVDPKTGLQKAKGKATSPKVVALLLAALVAIIVIRSVRRG
jgi:hypothetical protein